MRKIELAPYQIAQMESVLLVKIRECNAGIKLCNAEGNERGAEYIRSVKRKPLIYKLRDVRNGYVWE